MCQSGQAFGQPEYGCAMWCLDGFGGLVSLVKSDINKLDI
jgi:hypothetical protein